NRGLATGDAPARPRVNVTVTPPTISEAAGVATLTATLSQPASTAVTITLAFAGSAQAGLDYAASSQVITIPAGKTSGTMTIAALNNLAVDGDRFVAVSIANVSDADLADGQSTLAVKIVDD